MIVVRGSPSRSPGGVTISFAGRGGSALRTNGFSSALGIGVICGSGVGSTASLRQALRYCSGPTASSAATCH